MKIESTFTVTAPVETVWSRLTDVALVAPCLPGAEITDDRGDGSYGGTFTVKLGPATASYDGTLGIEELNRQQHTVTVAAHGTDRRGQGSASATIVSTLSSENGCTRVDVSSDVSITGRFARFGRANLIEEVSRRLLGQFATNLQAQIELEHVPQPAPAAPVKGIRVALSAIWAAIRRRVTR
jgi:carbon monoxide dehydrogenase subunit G